MNTLEYVDEVTNGILSLVDNSASSEDESVLATNEYFASMIYTDYQSYLRNYACYKGFSNENDEFDVYDIDIAKQGIESGYYITKHYDKARRINIEGRVIIVTTSDLTKCINLDI